ncbi:ATP-binding cassette sub-family C member 3-like, partial [Saccostrea cucullata]|uniref:ATP-binding cassette sub-family C member 3-like n=1 Tax=Saccostrea cuccullata TaxID=36930 RepID=UPI002ECFB2E0
MWEQLESVPDNGLSADDSDLSRQQSTRKVSLRRNSRCSIPTDIKLRLSQSHPIVETGNHLMKSMNNAESKRHFSRSNTKKDSSRQDEINPLEILQRSPSQGRILPYNSGGESEPADGKLIQGEKSAEGTVKLSVIFTYIKSMGVIGTVLSMLFVMLFQGLNAYGNFWLTFWTEDEIIKNHSLVTAQEYSNRKYYYLAIYTVLGVLQGIFLFLFAFLGLTRLITASGSLHSSMLFCILRSPMSLFDTTPVGRIMNRFSSDIDILDDRLPRTFILGAVMLFTLLAILVVISVNTPDFLIVIIPVGIFFILIL